MVFYFTGTGNSYAAAMQLQYRLGGRLINITDCVRNGSFSYEVRENESVGVVCPVYFGCLPPIVNDFLEKLEFDKKPSYLYGLITEGGRVFGAKEIFAKIMEKRGYPADAVWDVKMPANFAILYEPTHEEEADVLLDAADEAIDDIISAIKDRKQVKVDDDPDLIRSSEEHYKKYEEIRTTADYYSDDSCVGCGICASRCPIKAIKMVDGKPVWVKDKCLMCMSCARCNAIQYGTKLQGRYRYRHPVFRKKKKDEKAACH